jgi:hypothetical protein
MDRIQNLTDIDYTEINSIRNYLYQNTLSNHEVKNSVSSIDLEEFMKSRGYSNYQVSTEMMFLEKRGNNILFFEHASDANKRIRMYTTI